MVLAGACLVPLLLGVLEPTRLALPVTVQDTVRLPIQELAAAEAQASVIYSSIRVDIKWDAATDKGLHLVIVRSAAARLGATEDALGLTPATLAGPARRAYVFVDRVRSVLPELHMDFRTLLGCALAHELGHMLLPAHAHSETGIMRAFWDAAHFSMGGSDYLHFTPWQEKMIRLAIAQ
jgi:hypothetical protein